MINLIYTLKLTGPLDLMTTGRMWRVYSYWFSVESYWIDLKLWHKCLNPFYVIYVCLIKIILGVSLSDEIQINEEIRRQTGVADIYGPFSARNRLRFVRMKDDLWKEQCWLLLSGGTTSSELRGVPLESHQCRKLSLARIMSRIAN